MIIASVLSTPKFRRPLKRAFLLIIPGSFRPTPSSLDTNFWAKSSGCGAYWMAGARDTSGGACFDFLRNLSFSLSRFRFFLFREPWVCALHCVRRPFRRIDKRHKGELFPLTALRLKQPAARTLGPKNAKQGGWEDGRKWIGAKSAKQRVAHENRRGCVGRRGERKGDKEERWGRREWEIEDGRKESEEEDTWARGSWAERANAQEKRGRRWRPSDKGQWKRKRKGSRGSDELCDSERAVWKGKERKK